MSKYERDTWAAYNRLLNMIRPLKGIPMVPPYLNPYSSVGGHKEDSEEHIRYVGGVCMQCGADLSDRAKGTRYCHDCALERRKLQKLESWRRRGRKNELL
jgi:ribosomal protein L40E